MLTCLIFLAICSAGGVLGASVFNRKYEDILPITCSAMIILLFLCGIFGHLEVGVILILCLGLGMYIFSAIWVIQKKNFRECLNNLVTPGFCVFFLFALLFLFLDYGKLATAWDEFSHWADIVKVMY